MEARDRCENLRLGPKALEFLIRQSSASTPLGRQPHQTVRVAHAGTRAQEECIGHGEQRDVGAGAERQEEYRDERKRRRGAQAAKSEANVLNDGFHQSVAERFVADKATIGPKGRRSKSSEWKE